MADPDHVEVVKQRGEAISECRDQNPDAGLDLTEGLPIGSCQSQGLVKCEDRR